jgi:predicted nucleotidyltransferase
MQNAHSKEAAVSIDQSLLFEMVKAVVDAVKPSQVILFGSQAKGTANSESDVDFLIVEDEGFGINRSRRKEAAKVWRALAQFGIPTDVLMYSTDEVAEWRQSPNHVISRAFEEGQIVYERPETS